MAESSKIRSKYPDRIPVIVQKVETSNIERIDKRKYLVSVVVTAEFCENRMILLDGFQALPIDPIPTFVHWLKIQWGHDASSQADFWILSPLLIIDLQISVSICSKKWI